MGGGRCFSFPTVFPCFDFSFLFLFLFLVFLFFRYLFLLSPSLQKPQQFSATVGWGFVTTDRKDVGCMGIQGTFQRLATGEKRGERGGKK